MFQSNLLLSNEVFAFIGFIFCFALLYLIENFFKLSRSYYFILFNCLLRFNTTYRLLRNAALGQCAALFHCFTSMYSFYELFAYYARHLQRYFATIDPSEHELCLSDFHDVLLEGIDLIALERFDMEKDDPLSFDKFLSGAQLEGVISTLKSAVKEWDEERFLRHALYRLQFPISVFSPQPGDYSKEYEVFQRCCSVRFNEK